MIDEEIPTADGPGALFIIVVRHPCIATVFFLLYSALRAILASD